MKALRLFLLVIFFAGLLIFSIGTYKGIKTWIFLETAVKTEGIVIEFNAEHSREMQPDRSYRQRSSFEPLILYKDASGKEYEIEAASSSKAPEVGESRIIYYNPENPSEAITEGIGHYIVIIITGFVLMVIGIVLLRWKKLMQAA